MLDKNKPSDGAIQFLLHEYQNLITLHQDAKETGEKRLNFYITFTAAVGSLIIAVLKFINSQLQFILVGFGTILILSFGLVIFKKMIHRRIALIIYRRRLARIRAWFTSHYPGICSGIPFSTNENMKMDWEVSTFGSTAFSVAFINIVISIVLSFTITYNLIQRYSWMFASIISICTGFINWKFHVFWKNKWLKIGEKYDQKQLALLYKEGNANINKD